MHDSKTYLQNDAQVFDGQPQLWSPERRLQSAQTSAAIEKAISQLTPIEADLLACHFGLDQQPLSLRDAASRLGISYPQAVGIKRKALHKLRRDWRLRRVLSSFIY